MTALLLHLAARAELVPQASIGGGETADGRAGGCARCASPDQSKSQRRRIAGREVRRDQLAAARGPSGGYSTDRRGRSTNAVHSVHGPVDVHRRGSGSNRIRSRPVLLFAPWTPPRLATLRRLDEAHHLHPFTDHTDLHRAGHARHPVGRRLLRHRRDRPAPARRPGRSLVRQRRLRPARDRRRRAPADDGGGVLPVVLQHHHRADDPASPTSSPRTRRASSARSSSPTPARRPTRRR